MDTEKRKLNAWINLTDDEPEGTGYQDASSSYQQLIKHGIYRYINILNICFVNIVPLSEDTIPPKNAEFQGFTLQIQTPKPKKPHPRDQTDEQYMEWLVRDARAQNPSIKILATLGFPSDQITQLFDGEEAQQAQQVQAFAQNLVSYLQHYDLDGLDVDWEGCMANETTSEQFAKLFKAVGRHFRAVRPTPLLTLSPSMTTHLDIDTINAYFDFVSIQTYCAPGVDKSMFAEVGIDPGKLVYGAKFEQTPSYQDNQQDAEGAFKAFVEQGYDMATIWRINSSNFAYEQAQLILMHQMMFGQPHPQFDDAPIVITAGGPPITALAVSSGDVLNSLQATNKAPAGTSYSYRLPRHGGEGGQLEIIKMDEGDSIVRVAGYAGFWYGNECVTELTLTTRAKKTYGPYGSKNKVDQLVHFEFIAPDDKSIVAFRGLSNNGIIARLAAVYG